VVELALYERRIRGERRYEWEFEPHWNVSRDDVASFYVPRWPR